MHSVNEAPKRARVRSEDLRKARARQKRARREGGVLIESVMVVSAMMAIFGLLALVHHAAAADIDSLQQARSDAWRQATAGCPSGGFNLKDMVGGLARGELPIPDAYLPTHFSSATATHRRGSGNASRSVRIPCNSRPSSSDEASGDWVFDVLGP
jgi:hypothetical protein